MIILIGIGLFIVLVGISCVAMPRDWASVLGLDPSNESLPRMVGFGLMFVGAMCMMVLAINGQLGGGDGSGALGGIHPKPPAIFEGTESSCVSGDCIDGVGVLQIGTGSKYEGQFKAGTPHGHGVITLKTGAVYKGALENGELTGQGRFDYSKDEYYEGEFKQGKKVGYGRMRFSDGSQWTGGFDDDSPAGDGVFLDQQGVAREGRFENGEFLATGAVIEPLDFSGQDPEVLQNSESEIIDSEIVSEQNDVQDFFVEE